MQGSASLSLCARRQPKRWWVVQWKNSESTDILEVVFQVAQENENHLKRLHSNDSIDLLTYMVVFVRSGLLHANCELSTVVIRLWTWVEFSTYPQIFKVRWRKMI